MTADWSETVVAKSRQFSITFMHLGVSWPEARAELSRLPGTVIGAREFLDVSAPLPELYVLDLIEDFSGTSADLLSKLRERVMSAALLGSYFLLISRVPKTAFPAVAGSDLIADAKQLFPESTSSTWTGLEFSDELASRKFYHQVLTELGDRVVEELAAAQWEMGLSPNEALRRVSIPSIDGLRGARLVTVEGRQMSWQLPTKYPIFRSAVAQAASEQMVARDHLASVFVDLWVLERTVRNAVRRALMDKMGNGWRNSCLPNGWVESVLERAQRDAHPSAVKLSDLRDPLEWLTTNELLQLREERELGDLGMASHLWTKLAVEVLPIRNRVAHMRVIHRPDSERVAIWRKLVTTHLT